MTDRCNCEREPLGLPRGSVRSIIALALTGALVASVFVGVPAELIAVIAGPFGFVIKAYFDTRAVQPRA